MEEKELFKKINEESENNVPDVYGKVLFAAQAEGLLDNDNAEVYSDGETVALGGVNKKAIAVTTLAALAAVSLAIALPIALSGKPDGGLDIPPFGNGDNKIVADIDLGDSYSYGAVTTARLAESFFNEPTAAKAMAKRSVSENDFHEFGTYFSALDCYLGKDQLSLGNAPAGDYQKSITISGRRTNGREFGYAMHYTEYKIVKNDYVSGTPVEYYLEGMISVSGGGFALIGNRTLASDAEGAEETALDLYAYPNLNDKTTYARMQLQYVEIDGVTVKGYSYKIVKGSATVSEAVAYKPADADLVINIKDGETDKGNFTVTGETEGGYNVNYVLGAEEGHFKITSEDNGFKYEFPDPEDDYSYLGFKDNGDGTYSVTTYDKTAENLPETLVIPSTYNGKPVVSIGSYAFSVAEFKKIIISDGITEIESNAFQQCIALEEVEFPSTLTYIGHTAFFSCTNLKELNLPSSLKEIASSAFMACYKLTDVTIPEGVEKIGTFVFNGCHSLKTVNFPASLKILDGGAFAGCRDIESVTVASGNPVYHSTGNCVIDTANKVLAVGCKISVIPADGSVTKIGSYAFSKAYLTELDLPSCVTDIGYHAFEQNDFTSLTLTEGLQSLGEYAFGACFKLTEITLPSTLETIGDYAFGSCYELESVTIPQNVTSIGVGVFEECRALTELTVDSNNTVYLSAGNCIINTESKTLVAGCKSSEIPADGSVEIIGDYAFYWCRLSQITIPSEVKKIGQYAFSGNAELTSVVMEGVTHIGFGAFDECFSLATVVCSDDLEFIGDYAFQECRSLTSITLPKTLNVDPEVGGAIGMRAFYGCESLESIVISEGTTALFTSAFRGCTNLTTVTIPKTVELISEGAFSGCNSLTTVNFGGTMEEWQKLDKHQDTWSYTGDYTVVCTDGTLDKVGNVIN